MAVFRALFRPFLALSAEKRHSRRRFLHFSADIPHTKDVQQPRCAAQDGAAPGQLYAPRAATPRKLPKSATPGSSCCDVSI